MSFPRNNNNSTRSHIDRDFSLYSASTDEGSIGRARHDLDRCAQILNEVLDNGTGILDGAKKRKCQSSPHGGASLLEPKKVRQTNRLMSTARAVTSSTPQHAHLSRGRRCRSSSAGSVCSYDIGSRRPKRNRSLSEQRVSSTSAQRSLRTSRSLSAPRRSTGSKIIDSVASVLANDSDASSEADTLTGVHLDNSSQFGIPPVCNPGGGRRLRRDLTQRGSKRAGSSSTHHHANMGWLKPQTSISTQTLDNYIDGQTALKSLAIPKKCTSNKGKASLDAENKQRGTKNNSTIRMPSTAQTQAKHHSPKARKLPPASSPSGKPKLSPPLLVRPPSRVTRSDKENDVDDLLERTLTDRPDNAIATQMEVEDLISQGSSGGGGSDDQIKALLDRIQAASQSEDKAVFTRELGLVGSTMRRLVRESDERPSTTAVDQLLIPFQRESRELREQVQHLKRQLAMLQSTGTRHMIPQLHPQLAASAQIGSGDALTCTSSHKAVEAQNAELSNQLADMITELNEEKRRVSQLNKDVHYYSEQVDDLKRENRQLHLDLSSKTVSGLDGREDHKSAEDSASIGTVNQKLQALQQSMRMFHTRLTHIAAQCDSQTAKHLNSVLELCAHRLIESMENPLSHITHENYSTNSKWEKKPGNLAEMVCANLTKSRAGEDISRSTVTDSVGEEPRALVYSDHHPTAGQAKSTGYPPDNTGHHFVPERIPDFSSGGNRNPPAVPGKLDNLASDSRYSMTQYFHKYHPEYEPLSRVHPTGYSDDALRLDRNIRPSTSGLSAVGRADPSPRPKSTDQCSNSASPSTTTASTYTSSGIVSPAGRNDQLHSTLVSEASDSASNADVDTMSEVSTLSMATTVADHVFQEGLAQLDANIAKLQHSLRTSRLGATL